MPAAAGDLHESVAALKYTWHRDRFGYSYAKIFRTSGSRQPAFAESYGGHEMPLPQEETTHETARPGHHRFSRFVFSGSAR
jgi:hypothetical protein